MPTPIPFSVAAAQRTGSFATSVMDYPGGYSLMYWELSGLGAGAGSDYENTGNHFLCRVLYSLDGGATFAEYDRATWDGGHAVGRGGAVDPTPALSVGLANLPVSKVKVQIDLTGTMTIGIQNGLIS